MTNTESFQAKTKIDTSKLNVELLRQIKEAILSHAKQFDMGTWTRRYDEESVNPEHTCGTTACIAGWGAIISGIIDDLEVSANNGNTGEFMDEKLVKSRLSNRIDWPFNSEGKLTWGGSFPSLQDREFTYRTTESIHFSKFVALLLGMDETESELLFFDKDWPEEFSNRYRIAEVENDHQAMAQVAADRIEHLIQYGE